MNISIPKESRAQTAIPSAPIDPLLKDREAAPLLGISVPTFWRRVADGTIPKPIKLGALSRWPQSEILEVIERAKAARHDAA
ncbi:AlpA family transcriptional regulator [Paracoccus versutus]|uniref:helix-turn-helix transcriptional regulator n=1 Tax=Paracoccus versutus TaxID=34007 RepID=UPI001FB7E9A5|nr:AlpA family transcriptional regulator [Paracoccus versutus]